MEFVDLGLSEVGEFEAIATITDGSEGRLLRDDDFNILFDEAGNALIDEEFIPEFADVGSAGRVFGFDVVFPALDGGGEETSTLDSVCAGVADGTATANDLALALTAAGVLVGDADQNGSVEFADFLILSQNFGQSPAGDGATFHQGDFDCNGTVEFSDFLSLSANFGQSFAAGSVSSVPEPDSGLLEMLTVGCCVAALHRCRNR